MLTSSPDGHQTNLFGTDLLMQLDPADPLLKLARAIPWQRFDEAFAKHYTLGIGAPSKPIRLMVGLLLLKQLEDLSDEEVVVQWKRNPYYQVFCGMTAFQKNLPCHSTELVHFRKRIGKDGFETIFQMSVGLRGRHAEEDTVNIDTTVQEKNITYPTDSKLAIKIINRLNKIAKHHSIQQRRTYIKEVKNLRLDIRHFRHVKKRGKARRAAIEPIIGHLKFDHRLSRNFLQGILGDEINLLMAATAWNLRQWLIAFISLFFPPLQPVKLHRCAG